MKNRNVNLDLIKCIACIGVVGLHSVGMINYTIYYLCGCSVPLFFMVNGYLMFSKERMPYSYVFRKIGSILRVVVLWNLIIMLPVLIFRHKLVNPLSLCIKSFLQQGYLWHFWFFGALILIYLLLPILYRLLYKKLLLHISCCIILMMICVTLSIISIIKEYEIVMYVPQVFRLWFWLLFFLTGGLCAVLKDEKQNKLLGLSQKCPIWLHTFLVLLLACINNIDIKKEGLYLVHNRLADVFYGNLSSILWYTMFFLLLLRFPIKKDSVKGFLKKMSGLTIGIFILHPILLTGVNSFFTPIGTLQAVCLWIGLVIGTGMLTWALQKLPGSRFLFL